MTASLHLALLSAPLFSSNMGCNALTHGTLAVLREVSLRLGIPFRYSLVGNPPDGVLPSGLASSNIQLVDELPDASWRGWLRTAYRRDVAARRDRTRLLRGADILLEGGWGDSFSDLYGPGRFTSLHRHVQFAGRLGKPLIFLPQTIGPFQAPRVREQARAALQGAHAVYARDPLSAACARELVPGLEVQVTIDLAFFMESFAHRSAGGSRLRIGFNPSGLLWRGGYTGHNQFGLREEYSELVRSLLRHLGRRSDVEVVLIGHDIHGPSAGNTSEDYYVCKQLQREFPACAVAPFFYGPDEAKTFIAGLDLFLGSRMHACIAAYAAGVPVLPLAYSRKFRGLFAEQLAYPHCADLCVEGTEQVVNHVEECLTRLPEIRAGFEVRLRNLEEQKRRLVENLAERLGALV